MVGGCVGVVCREVIFGDLSESKGISERPTLMNDRTNRIHNDWVRAWTMSTTGNMSILFLSLGDENTMKK